MAQLRDDPRQFADLIAAAARALGVPPSLVEKDYWLTQVLRAVRNAHYGEFVLKGGTSLSKGYQLLERLSEDVDLLLIPQGADHDDCAVETLLSKIEQTIEGVTGETTSRHQAEEGIATITIAPYPSVVMDRTLAPEIRVDHGVPGRPVPSESRPLHTLLSDAIARAGTDLEGFADLSQCTVMMLHPARTLVEKLCIVAGIGTRIANGNCNVRSREARHFYDLWYLLDDQRSPALAWLREQDALQKLVDDCSRITERFYGTAVVRPLGGFATCSVFDDDAVAVTRKSYDKMVATLVFGGSAPSLDDVVARVRNCAADL